MTEKKYPEPIVSAIIVNDEGKIFLARGKKWEDKYTIAGGHIEWGEGIETALKREIMEETGLEIEIGEVLNVSEGIFLPVYQKKVHMIFINYICYLKDGDGGLNLNNEFHKDYQWVYPEDALKLDLVHEIKPLIKKYINYRDANK